MMIDVPDQLHDPALLCAAWSAALLLASLLLGATIKKIQSKAGRRSQASGALRRDRLRLLGT
mgnify:CR=1 FL=1